MKWLGSALIVALGFLSAIPTEADAAAFPWRHDLDSARAEAAQTGRLVLAHFWAPWCGPCKRLDRTVFTKPEVAKAITANYVPVKLNIDQNAALAKRLGIKGVPNDVIFTPDGQVVGQFVSPATSDHYVSRMGQIAEAFGNANARQQIAHRPTSVRAGAVQTNGTQAINSQAINSAYANLAVSTDAPASGQIPAVAAVPVPQMVPNPMAAMSSPTVASRPPFVAVATQPATAAALPGAVPSQRYRREQPNVQSTPPPSYGADRYAIPQQSPQGIVQGKPSASANVGRYAVVEQAGKPSLPQEFAYPPSPAPAPQLPVQTAPPSTRFAQNRPASPEAAEPPATQIANAKPASSYGIGTASPQPSAVDNPRTGFARPAVSTPSVAQNPIDVSRAGQNPAGQNPNVVPLGLDGYCPISLRNASLPPNDPRRWVRGDVRWGAVHRGRTYLFAGQVERDQFLRSPDEYAPVLSGIDPILAFNQGQMVPGKRELGVWYGGQIYLFSSEQSIEKFSQDPALYAERIRQAMNVGKPTTLR